MHQIKNISALLCLLLLSACIKPYDPVIRSDAENKYVISGQVTDTEGWQVVHVSLTSSVESPEYIPVSGCMVKIQDNKGFDHVASEFDPGLYKVWMRQIDLMPGTSYRVQVVTREGVKMESAFDQMPTCPPLDSVYYGIVDVPTSDPAVTQTNMQFYVDLNAAAGNSHYYKWDIVETFEYHAAHPGEFYYDGDFHEIKPPDYSTNVCYSTGLVKNIFTLSTVGLAQNSYKKFPLHFVDGTTARLAYLYSILVYQTALSEGAYNYWDKLRINSNEQGGLYEKQPLAIKGNLVDITNPEQDVLGYFYASSTSSRRYFFKDIEGITLDYLNFCSEDALGRMGWLEFSPSEYPVYYYFNELGYLRILTHDCIDCRLAGGTLQKPDFWPK